MTCIAAAFGRPPLAGPGRVRILVYVSVVVFLSRFPPRILISLLILKFLLRFLNITMLSYFKYLLLQYPDTTIPLLLGNIEKPAGYATRVGRNGI